MNRTIKFRAWDTEKKCWIKDTGTTFTSAEISEGQLGISLDGHLRVFQPNHYKEIRDNNSNELIEPCLVAVSNSEYESVHPVNTEPSYKRQYELQQFTGLVDKNGNETYEGDIVRATMRGGEPHFLTKVGVITFSDYLKALVVHLEGEDIDDSQPVGRFYELEVIGNIYENPELLQTE